MAKWRPTNAGPKTLRLLYHWVHKQLVGVGEAIGDEGTDPGNPGHQHDHNNLLNVTPDQHHNQVHLLYGPDHSDVDSASPLEERHVLGWDSSAWNAQYRTEAVPYAFGRTYYPQQMVYADGYLSVANKVTTDIPYPLLQGTPQYTYEGIAPTASVTAKQVVFGQRYKTPDDIAYQLTRYRIYTVTGNTYRVFFVLDPETNPVFSELGLFTANVTGWVEFNQAPIVLLPDTHFDLVAIADEPDPTPTIFSGDWDYQKPNNPATPGSGVISHANREAQSLRVNKTDNNAGDRSAELATMEVGDVIELDGGTRWAIQAITDNGTWIDFTVAPAQQDSASGVSQFNFETKVATPITRMEDVNWWLNNPPVNVTADIEGLYIEDGQWGDIVPNKNAYGTDVFIQELSQSPDWDLFGIPSGAGGGGGEGGDSLWTLSGENIYNNNNGFVLIGTDTPDGTSVNGLQVKNVIRSFRDDNPGAIALNHVPSVLPLAAESLLGQINMQAGLVSGGGNTGVQFRAYNDAEWDGLSGDMPANFRINIRDGLNLVERFRITSNGNVGIGTDTPNSTLHVNSPLGQIHISSEAQGFSRIDFTNTVNPAFGDMWMGSLFTNLYFGTAGVERMRIDSLGNVAIGRTNPAARLHVDSTTTDGIILAKNGTDVLKLQTDNTENAYLTTIDGNLYFRAGGVHNLLFWTDGIERMRINSNGQLLVNRTSGDSRSVIDAGDPSVQQENWIQVRKHFNSSAGLRIGGAPNHDARIYVDPSEDLYINYDSRDTPLGRNLIIEGQAGSEKMRINAAGNVGINLTNPAYALDVKARGNDFSPAGVFRAASNWGRIDVLGDGQANGVIMLQTNTGVAGVRNLAVNSELSLDSDGANGQLKFKTGNITRVQIDGDGDMAIGGQSPTDSAARVGIDKTIQIASYPSSGGTDLVGSVSGVVSAKSSDARLKTELGGDIQGLDIVNALRPVRFHWNEGKVVDIGFIAQEVEDHIPEAVPMNDDGYYGYRSDPVIAVLTKAVQELSAQVKDLEQRLEEK